MDKTIKLFSAAEEAAATGLALEYFNCGEDALYLKTLVEGNERLDWLVLAVYTGGIEVNPDDRNAAFNLFYEEDGVYFELYPAGANGIKSISDVVDAYFNRKSITSLDKTAITDTLAARFGRVKIAPPQEEILLNEDINITFSAGDIEAFIEFLPPDEGGEQITVGQISDKARAAGVIHGVSIINISKAVKEKAYGVTYPIAKATMPINGVDGSLTYHFSTEVKTSRPGEDVKGKVDFRNLELFEPVKDGQLLVTRELATPGTPGTTVKGDEIKPVPGKEATLPRSENVEINEDMTAAYSKLNGYVRIVNNSIIVSNVYTVAGDCDLTTGNINFDGNVVITGAVISGMVINATGNISVGGVVNDAELIAGGNIDLRLGIQGAGRGTLTAGGSIKAQFIERSDVKAAETITADVILHSNIEVGRTLFLNGKRGNIMGGRACVGSVVTAKTIGGPSHVLTEIEVGIVPEKLARLKFLKEKLDGLEQGEKKIQQLEAYLSKATNLSDAKRAELTQSVEDTRALNAKLLMDYASERDELQYEAEHATDGKVHCVLMAYPGMKISIGNATYKVNEQTRAATFKYSEGSIKFTPCEVRL